MSIAQRSRWLAIIAIALVAHDAPGQQIDSTQTLAIARAWSQATADAMQPTATPATIDRVLAFLSDTAVYEHPLAGARIPRAQIGEGMRGHIGDTRNARITILGDVVTPAGVELEEDVQFEVRDAGKWTRVHRRQLRILQFAGNKIVRVIEAWLPAH